MHTIDLDRTELELEIQGSNPMRCGGPQVTSCVDTNIAFEQGKPGASHPILDFYFELISLC
jgi:hypothetical protein